MDSVPLSPLHEHGLPRKIDWTAVRSQVSAVAPALTYPPEQVVFIGPDGAVRGWFCGDDRAVTVPFEEMKKMYQAVVVHLHPPGRPPTLADVALVTRAACPLFICLEGDQAHMVWVWSLRPPGYVAEAMLQSDDLASALHTVDGTWRILPRDRLASALVEVAEQWHAFLAGLGFPLESPSPSQWDAPTVPVVTEVTPQATALGSARRPLAAEQRGVGHQFVRYLSWLRDQGRFAIRTGDDGSVVVELDGEALRFSSVPDAWEWLRRAEQVGLQRLLQEHRALRARHP